MTGSRWEVVESGPDNVIEGLPRRSKTGPGEVR